FDFIKNIYDDFRFYLYAIGSPKRLTKNRFDKIIKSSNQGNNCFFYVAKTHGDNLRIGCIKGNLYDYKKSVLWINAIMINRKYCRRGYGLELVEEIINFYTKEHNIQWIYVSVAQNNKIGMQFWEKLGFTTNKIVYTKDSRANTYGNIIVYRKSA
ncbi:MAG: GNAT family N-acetyltransferase, partial [Epulopiscium sp.]|nr:GNAT family N-acetyltransferase [Candidatus Epulonipiscium sp.]